MAYAQCVLVAIPHVSRKKLPHSLKRSRALGLEAMRKKLAEVQEGEGSLPKLREGGREPSMHGVDEVRLLGMSIIALGTFVVVLLR
jgi:hypothetical protein